MQAQAGDELTIRGRQGGEDRHGTIVVVVGRNGTPPYVVHWRDGQESVLFPEPGIEVQRKEAGRAGNLYIIQADAGAGELLPQPLSSDCAYCSVNHFGSTSNYSESSVDTRRRGA